MTSIRLLAPLLAAAAVGVASLPAVAADPAADGTADPAATHPAHQAAGSDPSRLAFERALGASVRLAPQLAAQRHALRAAQEMVAPAGQLPDPKLQLGVENVPAEGPDAWSINADPMTMRRIGLMQDFPGFGKLAARTERAERMVSREQAAFDVAAATVRRDVATAWLDRWLAEQTLSLLRELLAEADSQVKLVTGGVAGGRVQATDVLKVRNEVLMIRDRVTDAEREVSKAVAMLERFLGSEARMPLAAPPDVTRLPAAAVDARELAERRPEIRLAEREVEVARADASIADLARRPDWNLELSYGIRRPNDNMVGLMVSIDLPLFPGNRQHRESAAKLAKVEELRAQRQAMVQMQEAELKSLLADWTATNEKLDRFVKEILPLTRDRLWTTTAAYGADRTEIGMVLEARSAYADALVQQLMLEKERARLWAQITYVVLPEDTK